MNDYFKAVAVKRLSSVEADAVVSNQHEYNGVTLLKKMFGTDRQKKAFSTHFLYLTDEEDAVESNGELTWYDVRYNHPTRTEWRLYYPSNDVTMSAAAGDSLFICLREDGTILEIVAKKDSIIENQLFWLFDVWPDEETGKFVAKTDLRDQPSAKVSFTARMILYSIGIQSVYEEEDYIDLVVGRLDMHSHLQRSFPHSQDQRLMQILSVIQMELFCSGMTGKRRCLCVWNGISSRSSWNMDSEHPAAWMWIHL